MSQTFTRADVCRQCGAPREQMATNCEYCRSAFPGLMVDSSVINRLLKFFDDQDEDKRVVDRTGYGNWGASASSWCASGFYSPRRYR